ncbi:MAG: hypothetical protein AB7G10_19910 [Reyranellaceae bacterium]
MSTPWSVEVLRKRITSLPVTRRAEYLSLLEAALEVPEGAARDSALRRLTVRTLRAEFLDGHPRLVR